MTGRVRIAVLAGIVVLAVIGATVYVVGVRSRQRAAADSAPPQDTSADVTAVSAVPHLVFRNTALGQGYGRVAVIPLAAPAGARALTAASCERVYAVARAAICLSADRGLVTTYRSTVLGADWKPTRDLPLTGLPSRARLSRDGTLAATTTFVYGDSYASPGQFSTRTLVSRTDGSTSADLEEFELVVDGRTVDARDRNLWGVTLVDDDRFYATAASGGRTWLVRGSLTSRRMAGLRGDVECPSLSPDGKRIAFKKHGDLPAGQWRLAVLDLATGVETVLAEKRSVDDQAEWLDNDHVVYGMPRTAAGSASADVGVVPADGTGAPRVLVPDAWSPAVVR
jgi:hypothetical protein